MADQKYWLWLTTRKGLGPVGALAVLDCFTTPERAYYGEKDDYEPLPLPPFVKNSLLDKSLDEPNRIMGECDRLSVEIMTFQDAGYPCRLRQLADPPVVLYSKGKTFRFDEEAAIGVVGMRRCTAKSRERAERFGMELASGGALVVSGIAEGIDACAVTGALKAGKPVVSLLAGGVDRIFPRESRWLYEDVAAAGALISEYPPGTPHKGEHFSPRNRILSGLCLGVLAVECEPAGGTMLTVNHALVQGREVYAVPIGLDERAARGTNALIRRARPSWWRTPGTFWRTLRTCTPPSWPPPRPCPRGWCRPGCRGTSRRRSLFRKRRMPKRPGRGARWFPGPVRSPALPTTSWLSWPRRRKGRSPPTRLWKRRRFPPSGCCPPSPCSRSRGRLRSSRDAGFTPWWS